MIPLDGPFYDRLSVGQELPRQPSVTIDDGMAALYQSLVGERLPMVLDEEVTRAVLNNRDRSRRAKSHQMQRHRSERVERSFAHVCDSGGARRTWLRGLEKINKSYSMTAAAHNLGLLMRAILGSGKPRQLASLMIFLSALLTTIRNLTTIRILIQTIRNPITIQKPVFSTDC